MKVQIAVIGVLGLGLALFGQETLSQTAATWDRPPGQKNGSSDFCTKTAGTIEPTQSPGCVPKREFILAPDNTGGAYLRVHPEGTHLIVSDPARIWDVSNRNEQGGVQIKSLTVPLNAETYPVEGDWKLLASPRNADGMHYYQFDEILSGQKKVSPTFTDPDTDEFYHSVAELPGSNDDELKFRTVLYSSQKFQDYSVKRDSNGRYTKVTKGLSGNLCSRIRGIAPPDKRLIEAELEKANAQMAALTKLSPRPQGFFERLNTVTNEIYRLQRVLSAEGMMYIETPVISKDGTELVGTMGKPPTTKVLKIINESECELIEDLGFQTSKAMFSYPEAGKKGKLVFTSQELGAGQGSNGGNVQRVYVYDRDTKVTSVVSDLEETFSSYPNLTRDGRIMYLSKRNGCAGLSIVDLNQLVSGQMPNGNLNRCAKMNSSRPDGSLKDRSINQ